MNNYIINIFGAMTTGKSTLAETLQKHIERVYTVDYDVVKKQIFGFYSKRDREVATKITYDTLKSVSQTELPIIALLPPPKDEQTYLQVEEAGRKVINIELIAPLDTLVSRYDERLRALKQQGEDISKLRTVDEFKETVQTPYFRPDSSHTFDSYRQSPDEIFETVKNLI